MNNENTWAQEGEHHTLESVGGWGARRGIAGGGEVWGAITLGEIPNVGDRGMEAANHHGICIPIVTSLHNLHM